MKKVIIRGAVLSIYLIVFACSNVPQGLNDIFFSEFNNAKDVQWIKENDSIWNVSFYQKEFYYKTASYNLSGQKIALEWNIYGNEVPNDKVEKIRDLYPGCHVFDVFEIKTTNETKYIFEIEYQGELIGVFFTTDDNFKVLPKTHKRFRWRFEIMNN